jgi:hypothetical protein
MSFSDLYREAMGHDWSDQEREGFERLDQQGRNAWVRRLAAQVDSVQTELKHGTDGVFYLAFWMDDSGDRNTTTAAE